MLRYAVSRTAEDLALHVLPSSSQRDRPTQLYMKLCNTIPCIGNVVSSVSFSLSTV